MRSQISLGLREFLILIILIIIVVIVIMLSVLNLGWVKSRVVELFEVGQG